MTDTCHKCGEEYTRVATHWTRSSCPRPAVSDSQHEAIKGLVLGDGCVALQEESRHPYLIVACIEEDYLNYLSKNLFPLFSHDVTLSKTAEENAQIHRETGFRPNADAETYSDVYRWRTMAHPELHQYRDWYSSGSKVFPKDIKLTPTTLKHWYCGDGHFDAKSNYASITMSNERENYNKITKIFKWAGFEDFTWFRTEQSGEQKDKACIKFNREGTRWLFRYIGDPLPGFEHKWPDNYTYQNNDKTVNPA